MSEMMSPRRPGPSRAARAGWWRRVGGLLLLLIAPQVVLYGPSLVGVRLLLPLDILVAIDPVTLANPQSPAAKPWNGTLADQVLQHEPWRRYVADQVRQGRIPLWHPANFGGYPLLAANQPAVFSPYRLLDYAWPGPEAIAWGQLARAVVAGLGTFLWLRRGLGLSYLASALAGAAYPLTGTQILWVGCPHAAVTSWLPWMLFSVDAVVRRPAGWGGPGLALVTAAALVSGHASFAVQVLLAGGLWALWRLVTRGRTLGWSAMLVPAVALLAGVGVGALLSAPQSLPTLEYMPHGQRLARRIEDAGTGTETSLKLAAQLAFPNFYGSEERGSLYLKNGNRPESAAAGYAGWLALAVAAPLAWLARAGGHRLAAGERSIAGSHATPPEGAAGQASSGTHPARGDRVLWTLALLGLLAAGDVLALPGLDQLYDLFPFSLLRNNRFVFVTALAIVAWAAAGLEALVRGRATWSPGWGWLVGLIALMGLLFVYRGLAPGGAFLDQVARRSPNLDEAQTVVTWFRWMHWSAAAWCLVAVALWLCVRRGLPGRLTAVAVGLLWLGELLGFARGLHPQSPRELYYPRLPELAELAERAEGRICGVVTLPPNLNQRYGLTDIRGYDAVDPAHLIDILERAAVPGVQYPQPEYAVTQFYAPSHSRLLDMLAVRYFIHPGQPPAESRPLTAGKHYWVEEITRALPRVFVPRRWEERAPGEPTLAALTAPEFNPRDVAYVDQAPEPCARPVAGSARIASEEPDRVTIEVDLASDGLVVLADLWLPGWEAEYRGIPARVIRVNHVLRGAFLPAGRGELVFRYRPASWTWGLRLAAGGALGLALWAGAVAWVRKAGRPNPG